MRHIDDKKDENILRAREFLKKLKERGISSYKDIRGSDSVSLGELREIASEYSTLFYRNRTNLDNKDASRIYGLAEDLYAECRKIYTKHTRNEFDIAVKIAILEDTSENAQRRELIDYIDTKIVEYGISDDSDIHDRYNKALQKSSGLVDERQQEERVITERQARHENRFARTESPSKKEARIKLQEQKQKTYDEKYNKAKQNASEKGEFWTELVDYVYSRLETGILEGYLNAGFPKEVENGYNTPVSYIFLNKSFKDEIFEEAEKEPNPDLKRLIRENAIETGRKNLEDILGTGVFLSGSSLSIIFH